MKKFLICLFCVVVSTPVYSDALDRLKSNINKEKAEKLEQKRKEKINKEHLADCKQAMEKADARKTEIEKELGKNIISADLSGKIVDLAKNGIFVENDCAEELNDAAMGFSFFGGRNWMSDLMYASAIQCKENRRFVYTTHTDYIVGRTYVNDNLLIYEGIYKYKTIAGNMNSVPAYKEIAYKISEIDYRTYLNDKSNTNCPK